MKKRLALAAITTGVLIGAGANTAHAYPPGTDVTVPETTIADTTTTEGQVGGNLPDTGSSLPMTGLPIGLAAIAGGTALLVISKRRGSAAA